MASEARLVAHANVERQEGEGSAATYRFVDADPQFLIEAPGGAGWGRGWHVLEYTCVPLDGKVVAPCLYPDFGEGYSEATKIELPVRGANGLVSMLLVFPAPVVRLRFDPTASSGEFRLGGLGLRPVGKFDALWYMLAAIQRAGGAPWWRVLLGELGRSTRHRSASAFASRIRQRYLGLQADTHLDYREWIEARGEPPVGAATGPLVSVVMPSCNAPVAFLREAVDSVRAQAYPNWEMCIADDASDAPGVIELLDCYAAMDPRIRVVKRPARGGISRATNDALAIARGDYLAFLDHDDVLTPNALGLMIERLQADGSDVCYSDHDHLSEEGERCDPFFKPDWSPDLFLSQMYLGHLVIIRASLVREVGGLDSDCDGAQDYDLVLRCWRAGASFSHVPEVLYHWRRHAGSTAANPGSKPYAHLAGQRALQRHVDARYPGGVVGESQWTFCYDVRFPLPAKRPLASIIIPTRDGLDLLEACVKSIRDKTIGVDYELLIVDNGSQKPETLAWLEKSARDIPGFRVLPLAVPFNWSLLNNRAAEQAEGDVLVFLNNDTEVISPDWLLRLCENALRPDVATCGALLLYPDETIQHAGVVVGMGGWADHVFKALPAHHHQKLFVSPMLRRNVLAVTGACVAIATGTFRELGGFDESFLICGSDVELGLRGHHRGLLNVYLPEVRLYHHESKTRDAKLVPDSDFVRSAEAYGEYRTVGDPFYSRNLDTSKFVPTLGGLL
jgi:GT2 family glycosyltransferase